MLLLERGYQVPTAAQKKAFLIDKKMPKEGMLKDPKSGKSRARTLENRIDDRQHEEK